MVSLDDQAKLIKASWHYTVVAQFSSNLETDNTEDVGELCGVFSHEIPYWHHLNVDWTEICLKAIILANPSMHFLAVS